MNLESFSEDPREREPLFNAPLVAVALPASFILAHLFVSLLGAGREAVIQQFAFTDASLAQGRWFTLFTVNFLHGDWLHLLSNAGFGLALGVAPARLFGRDFRGAVSFLAFFFLCSVLASLAQAGVTAPPWGQVGASGGVSGLAGATARLLNRGGHLGPPWGRAFFGVTLGWVGINLALGLTGLDRLFSGGVAGMAWQAHIAGYFAGVALAGVFWRLSGAREPITQ